MKLSDINKLFAGALDLSTFKASISEEVAEYERLHHDSLGRKVAGSIPIIVDEDDTVLFGKEEFVYLCQAYIDGQINSAELAYISDAFTLAEEVDFPDQQVRDELEYLCYFDVNVPFSVEEVKEAILKIKN